MNQKQKEYIIKRIEKNEQDIKKIDKKIINLILRFSISIFLLTGTYSAKSYLELNKNINQLVQIAFTFIALVFTGAGIHFSINLIYHLINIFDLGCLNEELIYNLEMDDYKDNEKRLRK